MVITTINNNKLFIQLDRLVSKGTITVFDDAGHSESIAIMNSNFEEMDLSSESKKIIIKIETGDETITKTINI
jgi:hypothetical protein